MAATMQPQSQAFTPPVITSKEDILRFMMSLERSISRKELISRGLTRSTATRYLKQLVADGSIERMCYGHCQLTGKGRAWARVPPDSRYGGSLRQLDHDSTEDQNGDQAAQKGSRVPQNGGYGNKTNYIDEVTAQSARKETDNDSNCYPHPRFRQPGNDSNLSLARQPHESRSDSSRPAFRWMNRNDLPAAIHRLLQQCSKSALKFRNKTILEAKENRRSVPQTQLIDVPTYRLEAMNIDKYFRWNDRGLYVGLKESYLGSFHSTMTALAWEAGRNYASDMVMICQILDHEENLDNTQKVVETLSGFITEFQLVHKYARPDYICKEKKRAYAREHRQRLAAEARAAEAVLPDENEGLAATGLSPEEASYLSTERGIRWFDPNSSPEPSEFTLDEEVEDRSEVVPPAALNDQPQAVPQGTVNWPNT